jgi:hypothetical protein
MVSPSAFSGTRSVAWTIYAACSITSFRVTCPSGRRRVAAKPLLVVARAWNPSQASSLADPGPRGWVAAAAARHGAGPESGCSAQRGRSSRLPPSTSRSTTCANARHDRPPRPAVSNTAVPVHQVVRAMMPWAIAHKRSASGCGSISSQPVTMSRRPALMTQARASRRSPRTGASTLMGVPGGQHLGAGYGAGSEGQGVVGRIAQQPTMGEPVLLAVGWADRDLQLDPIRGRSG